MLEDVFLTQPVIGGILDVLGGETGGVDRRPAGVPAPDDVGFDQGQA